MRPNRARENALAALVLLGVVANACGGESSTASAPPPSPGDAGLDATAEDDAKAAGDAGPGGKITVEIARDVRDGPASWHVYFNDEKGELVADEAAGSDGRVVGPAAHQVTVIGAGREVGLTFVGTKDGDVLKALGEEAIPPTNPPVRARLAVSLPGPVDGAARYVIGIGNCIPFEYTTDATTVVNADSYESCDADGKLVYASARSATEEVLAYAWKSGLAPSTTRQSVTLGPWTPTSASTLTITNRPAWAAGGLSLYALAPDGHRVFFGATDSTVNVRVPNGLASSFSLFFFGDESRVQSVGIQKTVTAPPFSLDVDETLPPPASLGEKHGADGRTEGAWSLLGAAQLANTAIVAHMSLRSSSPNVEGAWSFVLPPKTTRVVPPNLPNGAFFGGLSPSKLYRVAVIDSDAVPNYDAARRVPVAFGARAYEALEPPPTKGRHRWSARNVDP